VDVATRRNGNGYHPPFGPTVVTEVHPADDFLKLELPAVLIRAGFPSPAERTNDIIYRESKVITNPLFDACPDEAKALGFAVGEPFFKARPRLTRQERRLPRYTTRWEELVEVGAHI